MSAGIAAPVAGQQRLEPKARAAFFSSILSSNRLTLYIGYCGLLVSTYPLLSANLAHPGYGRSLVLAYALGALVPLSMVFGRRLDLLEPAHWFALKYYLVFPGALYFLVTGFATSEHLIVPTLEQLQRLTEIALLLLLTGYLAFLLGYLAVRKDAGPLVLNLPSRATVSPWVGRSLVFFCIACGMANFLYLLLQYPDGAIQYLLDFGRRQHRFEAIEGKVTTLGYQLLYAGVFIWYLLILRDRMSSPRRAELVAWLLVAALAFVVVASQGRMSKSLNYLLILVFLPYVFSVKRVHTWRYVILIAGGLASVLILYFLRRFSVFVYGSDGFSLNDLIEFGSTFLSGLGYWIVDKGNVPNLAVLVNLVAQGGVEGELWYGRSLTGVVGKLSSLFGYWPTIGDELGKVWFGMEAELPPTIVGEMFVNFGYLGVPVMLFLIGMLCAWFYRFVRRQRHYIWYIIYLSVLFKFFFVWPKGETGNFAAAFWQFFPTVVVYVLIVLISGARSSARMRAGEGPGHRAASS